MPDCPARVEPAADVLSTEIGDETVLLNVETERYYGLDDVGTRCWQVLCEDGDVDRLIARLASEFDADEPTLRHDVLLLIDNLIQARLVRPVP